MPRPELRLIAAAGIATSVVAFASLAGSDTTYAAFSDFNSVQGEASAGVWAPDPPAACDEILSKPQATIVWGTSGDDVLEGTNHPQVIMGMGGNDVIRAGNSGDCLVGGDGDDELHGTNAKDILIGGPGNDTLDGGNGKDDIDGSDGEDVCIGGNGKNTVVNCEAASTLVAPLSIASDPDASPAEESAEEPTSEEDPAAPSQEDLPPTDEPAGSTQPSLDDVVDAESVDEEAAGEQAPADEPATGDPSESSEPCGCAAPGVIADPQPPTE
jgi:Ca2+-binding RTX toxin-like protein